MTRRCTLAHALSLIVSLAVVAVACGSTSDVTETPDASTEPAATASSAAEASDSSDSSDSTGSNGSASDAERAVDAPDSIEDYLGTAALVLRGGRGAGGGGGGPLAGIDTEQIAAEQQLIEVEVQKCMQAQGFAYVPEETGDGFRVFAAASRQSLSAEDYAATEGFGISTIFDEVFAGDISLTDDEPSPNDEALAAMSEGEAEAWLFALRGEPPVRNEQGQVVDPDTGEVIAGAGRGQATGGCQLDAQTIVRGDLSELADLSDAWEELQDRIDSDPRIAEIEREWAACMLDRGFDYSDVDEARADFQNQFRPLMRSFVQASFAGGAAGGADDAEGAGPGQGRGGAGGFIQVLADQGLTDEQEAELRALQDLEIAAAVASFECSGDSEAEIAEIEAAYEAEFLDLNRAELEAFAG